MDVLGPLGRGFSAPSPSHAVLLVAGGIGLPPIRWWAEILRNRGVTCHAVYGARTRDLIPMTLLSDPLGLHNFTLCAEDFGRHGIPTLVTTDDGSCGVKGTVAEGIASFFSSRAENDAVAVYACGPDPMLKETASICHRHGASCELAIERTMGCGIGSCQSCVVEVVDGESEDDRRYALCCTEGPVFESRRLIWA